jgi:hypothetical protein
MSSHSAYSNLQRQKRATIQADEAEQAVPGGISHISDAPTSTRPRKQARFDHKPVEQGLIEDNNSEQLTWANSGTDDNEDGPQASKVGDSAVFAINSLIMAICGDRSSDNRVSAVLYDSATTKMYVMEDTIDSTHYDQIYLCMCSTLAGIPDSPKCSSNSSRISSSLASSPKIHSSIASTSTVSPVLAALTASRPLETRDIARIAFKQNIRHCDGEHPSRQRTASSDTISSSPTCS